jgi:thioredoxin 1
VEKSSDNSSVFLCLVSQEFSSSWDIRATPTFFFLKNGQQMDKLVGANKAELQKKVAAVAGAEQTDDACDRRAM